MNKNNGMNMKYTITASLLSFVALLNTSYGVQMTPQISSLLEQKNAKIAELEKCDSNRKAWMIAGISTIGLTAVGVGVNIAQAQKSKNLSAQIDSKKSELKNLGVQNTATLDPQEYACEGLHYPISLNAPYIIDVYEDPRHPMYYFCGDLPGERPENGCANGTIVLSADDHLEKSSFWQCDTKQSRWKQVTFDEIPTCDSDQDWSGYTLIQKGENTIEWVWPYNDTGVAKGSLIKCIIRS